MGLALVDQREHRLAHRSANPTPSSDAIFPTAPVMSLTVASDAIAAVLPADRITQSASSLSVVISQLAQRLQGANRREHRQSVAAGEPVGAAQSFGPAQCCVGFTGDEHLEGQLRQRTRPHDEKVLVSDDVRDRPKARVGPGRVEGERFVANGAASRSGVALPK